MVPLSCPCGLTSPYEQCCGKYITGQAYAPTPEALMRSRYTAYVVKRIDYIQATMQGPAAKHFDLAQTTQWNETVHWHKLTIFSVNQKTATLGFVSFEALYSNSNVSSMIREKSEFHKIGHQWFYISGKTLNPNARLV